MQRKKWIFDVAERRDVTQGNEAGLQPVFFSPDFQTIKTQHFVDSDVNYKNVGYVGGQGEGVERTIVKVGDSKGFDLHETFIDARDIGEDRGEDEEELTEEEIEQLLITRGEQKMREFETTFYLEAQILTPTINDNSGRFTMRTPFEYEKDFHLGDMVEVFNKRWNITMDAPITEFKEIHEANGFVLEAVFGEAQPTLIKKINDKFNELFGVDIQELPAKISVEKMKEAINFADERISEEERKRIEQALENLQESKQWADEKSYQAEQEAKRHADDQDTFYDEIAKEDAKNKADEAEDNSKHYADEKDKIVEDNAKQDASNKAKEAEDSAKDYTDNTAVKNEVYEHKVTEITQELLNKVDMSVIDDLSSSIADKVDAEWVNGRLFAKADVDSVYTIEEVDGRFSNVVSLTEYTTDKEGYIDRFESNETRISQTETELAGTIKREELNQIEDDLGNIGTELNQAKLDIISNADGLSAKADNTRVNTLEGTIDSHSTELNILAEGLQSKVDATYVEGAIDGIQLGGRNLLSNSNKFDRWNAYSGATVTKTPVDMSDEWGFSDAVRMVTKGGDHSIRLLYTTSGKLSEPMVMEVEYTYSVYLKNMGDKSFRLYLNGLGENNSSSFTVPVGFSGRIEMTGTRRTNYDWFQSQLRPMDVSDDIDVIIGREQIEKGNKAMDWSPAPEDTQSQINNQADIISNHSTLIDQNESAITQRATKTEVNNIENRVTEAESELVTMAGRIDAKAESSVVTEQGQRIRSAELSIDGLEASITSKVSDGEVRSIFTQEAGAFYFDANQINFNGHVFGTNATFSGSLQGVTGTFSGTIQSGSIDTNEVVIGYDSLSNWTDASARLVLKNIIRVTNGVYQEGEPFIIEVGNGGATINVPNYLQINSEVRVEDDLIANGRIYSTNRINADGGIQVGGGTGQYVHTNAVQNDIAGTNLYLRTFSGGEVRTTVNDTTTEYVDLRTQNIRLQGGGNFYFYGNSRLTHDPSINRLYLQSNGDVTASRYLSGSMVVMRASDFSSSSIAEEKQDIEVWKESALGLINNSVIYEYRRKDEVSDGKDLLRQGLVIGEGYAAPDKIINDGTISQYAMNSWSWKAIQELSDELTSVKYENMLLNKRVEELEKGVA
ncbi:hypothetical protein M3E13_19520, partial [Oceanobacillus kimchii]|nr:hypothetical protein [Oceanobacillus kimchii]